MLDEQELLATRVLNRTAKWDDIQAFIDKNYVAKSLIREKINYIDEEGYWEFTTDRDSDKANEILQELLGKE